MIVTYISTSFSHMPEGSSLQTISDPPAFDNPLFEPPKFDEVTCISIVKHCDEVIEQYHHGELVQTDAISSFSICCHSRYFQPWNPWKFSSHSIPHMAG